MKVLIVNTLYTPYKIGGAEKSVQSLADFFKKKNLRVQVLTLSTENKTDIVNGVFVRYVKIQNDYWPFENLQKSSFQKISWHSKDAVNFRYDKVVNKVFDEFKPDILFTNNLAGFSVRIWQLARKRDIKIIHTLRDYYLQCPKTTRFKNEKNCLSPCLDCKIMSIAKNKISKNVDAVVGISNFILEEHVAKGYFSKAIKKVIYNGFSLDKDVNHRRRENKKIVFGYIGQINQSKGIEHLLKTLKKIDKINDWNLIIAGKKDVNYIKKLKKINDSNKIRYTGYIDSNLFFNSIDVLIVPSLWQEPFGRVVLEGLMHKKVVVGSNVGGIKELLNENKDFLFTPNTEELDLILEKLITSSSFIEKFKFNDDFLNKFSIDNITDQYIKLFEEVLNK